MKHTGAVFRSPGRWSAVLPLAALGVFFIPFLYYVIQSLVDRRKDEAG